jgi:hypothetical protein
MLALVVFAAASSTLLGQPAYVRVSQSIEGMDHLILTPAAKEEVQRAGKLDPNHDYFGEVSAMLKGNPDAPYLCAALTLLSRKPETGFLPGAKELRDRELELCKSYSASKEQVADVQQWFDPPPPPRREQIVMQLQGRTPSNRWFGGMEIYAPPPLDPMDWINGNSQGRDYRKDVEAAFEADPLEAASVCVGATHTKPSGRPDAEKLHATLLDVCNAFPDSKIEAAFAARKSNNSRSWLTGLMNSFLDEAATLSTDLRRQEAHTTLAALPTTLRGSARFQNALRIIVLTPEDWRGPAAALRYSAEASQATPGAQASEVRSWLDEWYAAHSTGSADIWNWKRGARGFYALTGQLDRARSLANDIANHRDPQQHSLDLIYLAVIERAAGNRATYDRVFTDCPAPDPFYLQQNGQPPRPVRYCEDIASEFARAVRDELGTAPTAAEFGRVALETNRVAPTAAVSSGGNPPANVPSPSTATDDLFSSLVKTETEKVAKMTRVQRDEEGAYANPESYFVILDSAVHLLFLQPWREQAVFAALKAADSEHTSAFDKPAHIRQLFHDLLERESASSPDANEWKRGLRAYFLFTGDYARALDLGQQLIKVADPRFAVRDAVLLGLSKRIAGDRKFLDDAIRTCPQAPTEELERAQVDPLKPGDYCRGIVRWDISRAITLLHSNVPNAYKEVLAEIGAHKESDCSTRSGAISELSRLDVDAADKQWHDLLHAPDLERCSEQHAYWGLARIAEQKKRWQEGIYWVDRYIEMWAPSNELFTADLWKALAFTSEGTSGRNNEFSAAYDLRLRLSINQGDFENAHRTIEDMLTFGISPDHVQQIRLSLIQLAAAEVTAGQRQEPLRILGYVARQPLTDYLTAQLAAVRKQLGGAEPKREDSPWDSPQRKRRRINVVPAGTKAT